jgi:hypothetical protein
MAPVKEYDARIDVKKRVTLRGARYNHDHVREYSDGRIELEPRILAAPFEVSSKELAQMDSSMKNLKKGKASKPLAIKNSSLEKHAAALFAVRWQCGKPGCGHGLVCLAC